MSLLFNQEQTTFNLPNADISYFPNFFSEEEANTIFQKLYCEIPWQQDDIVVYGKKYSQPRLTALFGNKNKSYSYSSITMTPLEWTDLLKMIKNRVEIVAENHFTSVLLNLYRDGKDSNSWHSDNEKELGINPVIASVSFGQARQFQLKHNTIVGQKIDLTLENGSLLLMKGTTQHFWKHQIPKTKKTVKSRINLTFRTIL